MRLEGLGKLKKKIHLIGTQTRDLSACSLKPQPTTLLRVPVHAPTQDKIDDMKDSFFEEPEGIFDKFPKYHMKILLDFSAKVGREDILKPRIRNESTRN
jgi:hypothetical protein